MHLWFCLIIADIFWEIIQCHIPVGSHTVHIHTCHWFNVLQINEPLSKVRVTMIYFCCNTTHNKLKKEFEERFPQISQFLNPSIPAVFFSSTSGNLIFFTQSTFIGLYTLTIIKNLSYNSEVLYLTSDRTSIFYLY